MIMSLFSIAVCSLILHLCGVPVAKTLFRLLFTLTAIFALCYLYGYFNPPIPYTTLQF